MVFNEPVVAAPHLSPRRRLPWRWMDAARNEGGRRRRLQPNLLRRGGGRISVAGDRAGPGLSLRLVGLHSGRRREGSTPQRFVSSTVVATAEAIGESRER